MVTSLMVFQAIISVLLILLVLIQFGKGAEAGLIGGSSDAVFTGSQQGNIFSKMTVVLAIIFLGNSVYLAKVQSSVSSKSILDDEVITRPLNRDAKTPAKTEVEVEVEKKNATKADKSKKSDKK